ncbi:hypothetical protein N9917_03530 [Deltaproteobacteria bacterium]|nr:hypothetical protein [Deltaproteobacteria bacterium]
MLNADHRQALTRLATIMLKSTERTDLLTFLTAKPGTKTAKDLPKDVERYVEEGMDKGMDESKAWAIAWSRYCKYKNPSSPHCKKDKGSYFSGKSAAYPSFAEGGSENTEEDRDLIVKGLLREGVRAQPAITANSFILKGGQYTIHGQHLVGPGLPTRGMRFQESNKRAFVQAIVDWVAGQGMGKSAEDKEAIRPRPPKKDKCDAKQKTYGDYRSCTNARDPLTEKAWKSRQQGSGSWGINSSQDTTMNRTARKLHNRQVKVLQKYLDSAGSRAVSDYDDLPDRVRSELERIKFTETLWSDVNRWLSDNNNPHLRWASVNRTAADKNFRKSLIRLASQMPKGDRGRQELLHMLASEPPARVASSAMTPEVNRRSIAEGNAFMTYRIDENASKKGASKFYEGYIVPADGGFIFTRKWGALTDNATGKNIRTKDVWHGDLQSAQRELAAELKKRQSRHYIDANGANHRHPTTGKKLRKGQYPLGLFRPGVGFGHGTEQAASCVPALRDLAEALKAAISSIEDGDTVSEIQHDLTSALATLDRGAVDNRTTAAKIQKKLQLALRRLTGGGRFLPDDEQKRLRGDLVWVKNFVESQTAYCK